MKKARALSALANWLPSSSCSRIEPTGEQQRKLRQFAGMCRFVFKWCNSGPASCRAMPELFS
ncbi:helix-turn-helix domain-containing protein [Azotobacter chroococcum]|uniref:helix-turn-helix domain-containing protein n=1 Tax=Azotobacter chroococcum TaxID=353 RepID=UPI0009E2FFCC